MGFLEAIDWHFETRPFSFVSFSKQFEDFPEKTFFTQVFFCFLMIRFVNIEMGMFALYVLVICSLVLISVFRFQFVFVGED